MLLLGLSFTLLMVARPALRPIYAGLFRGGYEFLLGSFGPDGKVHFIPTKKPGAVNDSGIVLRNRRTGELVGT